MVVRTSHVVVAVLLHVIVLGLLLIGFHCTRKVEPPPVMQATLIGEKPQAKAQPPKEDNRKAEEEQRRKEADKKVRQEEERKKAEAEEQQRKAEQQAKAKAQEEARKKAVEEDARKARDEEVKREAEKKKQAQKQVEDQMRQQMQSEEKTRADKAAAAARASKQQVWAQQITEKVRRNWLRPPGLSDDFQCRLQIQLLPGGQVVGVKLLESCGNPILDESVQRAVLKSDPLPTPDDPSVFDRDLIFTFVPHD